MLPIATWPCALSTPSAPHFAPRGGFAPRMCTVEYLVGPVDLGCCSAWVEQRDELAMPRMCVMGGKPPLTDAAVTSFVQDFMPDVFALDTPFTVLWECRSGAFPSMGQFKIVLNWIEEVPADPDAPTRVELWDSYIQGNAITVSSPLLRGGIRLMNAIAQAPQPLHTGADAESALAFARDQCREVRAYSKPNRKRGGAPPTPRVDHASGAVDAPPPPRVLPDGVVALVRSQTEWDGGAARAEAASPVGAGAVQTAAVTDEASAIAEEQLGASVGGGSVAAAAEPSESRVRRAWRKVWRVLRWSKAADRDPTSRQRNP